MVSVWRTLAGRLGGQVTVTVRSMLFGTVADVHEHTAVAAGLPDGFVEHAQSVTTLADATSDCADAGIGADQVVWS